MEVVALGVLWYAVFVFSTTFHEAAHGFVAFKFGDKTAYHGGQVSLNPTAHIQREPFGMVLFPLLTYFLGGWMMGWASCPYDRYWAERNPRQAALMGLAGPASNLLLVIAAGILIHVGIFMGVFRQPDSIILTEVVVSKTTGLSQGVAVGLSIMFTLNLIMFVFNLLPLPPLDGVSLLEFTIGSEKSRRYRDFCRNPAIGMFGLFMAWRVFGFVFSPLHSLALAILYPGSWYS